jgi:hypothetical protein
MSETMREAAWTWYRQDIYTRLAPGGGILLMMTRWHEDDLAGRILRQAEETGETWRVVLFPAIAEQDEEHRRAGEALHEERYPLARLQAIRKVLGEYAFSALYQQHPQPATGGMFRRAHFEHRYAGDPRIVAQTAREVLISVDAADKPGDHHARSVILAIGVFQTDKGRRIRPLGMRAGNWEYPELEANFRDMCREWPRASGKLVEDAANGRALIQILSPEIPGIIPVRPQGDADAGIPGGSKADRATYTLRACEAGEVELPEDRWGLRHDGSNWISEIIAEHLAFPRGLRCDTVDAFSQMVIRALIASTPNAVRQFGFMLDPKWGSPWGG